MSNNVPSQVKDAAEIVVGLGILGFQRAQVQRQSFMKKMEGPRSDAEHVVEEMRSQLGRRFVDADQLISPILGRVETGLNQLERAVPDAGREIVRRTTAQAKSAVQELKRRLS